MEADITSQAAGLAGATDFSILSLFLRADIIVKSVIVILIAASIYSWAIIIEKIKLFRKINLTSEEFESKFWKSKSAETFYNSLPANLEDPMANLFKDTMQVVIKSRSKANLSERLNNLLEVNIEKQMNKISKEALSCEICLLRFTSKSTNKIHSIILHHKTEKTTTSYKTHINKIAVILYKASRYIRLKSFCY